MVYSLELLDALQNLPSSRWEGVVYRHMLNDYPPDRANTRGARWNPPEVAAIYASLARSTCLAEGQHLLSLQPLSPRVRRTLYRIRISLKQVLDLGSFDRLTTLGLTREKLGSDDFSFCQEIGGAVAWLGYDGLLVPSARDKGTNIVMFTGSFDGDSELEILDSETINK